MQETIENFLCIEARNYYGVHIYSDQLNKANKLLTNSTNHD